MNRCDEIRVQMTFYLDDELQGGERAALESHLRGCDGCRDMFDAERDFLESVRRSRPLRVAAPALRARVEDLLGAAPPAHTAPAALRQRVQRSMRRLGPDGPGQSPTRRLLAAGAIVAVLMIGLWALVDSKNRSRPNPSSDFALMAVDTHERYLRGQLPLEIASGAPDKVSAWFAGKVPFSVELPNYQESSGQEKLYDLEGARLVGYKNDYAAYVAYRMQMRPISLLITSDTVARPSGGGEVASKGIVFHYDSIGGLKVITWSDGGLTYALVSDLKELGQQSCIVCHQGTKDRDFIEGLKLP